MLITGRDNSIEFLFEENIALSLFENLESYEREDELFMLFINETNKVISYSSETQFIIEST